MESDAETSTVLAVSAKALGQREAEARNVKPGRGAVVAGLGESSYR